MTLSVLILVLLGLLIYFLPLIPRKAPAFNPAYSDVRLSDDERIEILLSQMTVREKIGQMALVEKYSVLEAKDVHLYGIGGILSGAGAKPELNTVEGWNAMVDGYVSASEQSRLGIPVLYGVDAIHGHSNVPGATIFPHFIGLGASGNEALVTEVAKATAEELTATGITWSYSPTLDLPKDIRWGRVYETFSDDPALAGRLGVAYLKGLHNKSTSSITRISVLGTLKHYIGAGSMQWNTSSNENYKIDQGKTPADEKALTGVYVEPFKKGVDGGALSVMVGLNSWGDTKLSAEEHLITDVLKNQLGFNGFVVSDWYSVYEIPGGDYRAAVAAINAGVDMVMLPFDYKTFVDNVLRAVAYGHISDERIDDAVRRILRAKFALGLLDGERQRTQDFAKIGSTEHHELARQAVSETLVLLKNDGHVLPINDNPALIRVAGSAADNVGRQMGAWTVEWQGIDGNWLEGGTSILEGIRAAASKETKIEYELGGNFKNINEKADIGIAVVGESPYAEGWGDRELPILNEEDRATIERLRAVSKKVVVVLVTGRPLLIEHELPQWDALVSAWLPGSEGAGVADVLFGKKPFVGTLPLPWPKTIEQVPIRNDGKTADGSEVLFQRFFGLH